ncbi:hypothetical protein F5Y15DRAFT_423538 [Xylariaceae sp. FL0016]|nr:hypothetical protein F5Y15DRAFT_423538 [Xylariaceae sp. FL0016]
MEGKMSETQDCHGSLVAFEGPQDVVSTQLRLLPRSSKILMLPSVQSFVRSEDADSPFDPREHILQLHKACDARVEMARHFLREAKPDNKRLVFMDGGTASTMRACIQTIAEHRTSGDFDEAEKIYNDLAQNGVADLVRRSSFQSDSHLDQVPMDAAEAGDQYMNILEGPAAKAMRAAEALDRQTASLQGSNDLDLTIGARPRSTSVPIRPVLDDLQDAAPFYIFGASPGSQNLVSRPPRNPAQRIPYTRSLSDSFGIQHPRVERWRDQAAREDQLVDPNAGSISPNCVGETYPKQPLSPSLPQSPHSQPTLSPQSLVFGSLPNSPAVIAEATVVDVRSSKALRRKKGHSIDRIYASGIRNQDISLCTLSNDPFKTVRGQEQPQPTPRNSWALSSELSKLKTKFTSDLPRATFGKPSKTIIRRGLPSPLNLSDKSAKHRSASYADRSTSPKQNYVNRSTWTGPSFGHRGSFLDLDDELEFSANEPYSPVLPIMEDLVIHFTGDERDGRLDAMIQSLQNGTYPISMPTLSEESSDDTGKETKSITRESTPPPEDDGITPLSQPSIYQADDDEYDPFASHGDGKHGYKFPLPPQASSKTITQATTVAPRPPTPAQTPPPPGEPIPAKTFHELKTANNKTAICTQNALRSVLNIYFSPEDIGYHQFSFPLLPEMSNLWKPVFREAEPGSRKRDKPKMDLILAIGAQKGVERDFLGAISGSLEKLGTKPNGTTRSGKLDLRYLIANAMQVFTAQPLANQTQENPFSNPMLLATLIIPHLETYMAAHSDTRFLLLEYPPEHLKTVLAMQRLVGVDLLKVAGIVDAEVNEPKPYKGFVKPVSRTSTHSAASSISGSSAISKATLLATGSSKSGARNSEAPSFARANFLLTSTATESEIATFISTIWKILIDISSFYVPEGAAPRTSFSSTTAPTITSSSGTRRRSNRRSSDRPVAPTPLIDAAQEYAPLASAAAMLGFPSRPTSSQPRNYVSSGTTPDPQLSPAPSSPPLVDAINKGHAANKSSRASVKSSRTARTVASQRSKLRNLLGRDFDGPTSTTPKSGKEADDFDFSDDDSADHQFAAEERKYMPLWNAAVIGPRKGSSRKALKWLGLAN